MIGHPMAAPTIRFSSRAVNRRPYALTAAAERKPLAATSKTPPRDWLRACASPTTGRAPSATAAVAHGAEQTPVNDMQSYVMIVTAVITALFLLLSLPLFLFGLD